MIFGPSFVARVPAETVVDFLPAPQINFTNHATEILAPVLHRKEK